MRVGVPAAHRAPCGRTATDRSLELRRAALVAATADGGIDGLAEGADAGHVVSGGLLALPLEVGEPDEEDREEDGLSQIRNPWRPRGTPPPPGARSIPRVNARAYC